MRALLQTQQKKHQFASAVGSSLLERTHRQQQQQKAAALRWQWKKIYGHLRNQEMTLSYDLKQLLASQDVVDVGCGSTTPPAEIPAKEVASAEAFRGLSGAKNAAADADVPALEGSAGSLPRESSAVASPADLSSTRAVRDDCTSSLMCSLLPPFGRFTRFLHDLSSIMHLLKQWDGSAKDATGSEINAGHRSPPERIATKHVGEIFLASNIPQDSWINQPWQVAGCLLQLVTSAIQEAGAALEMSYASAKADASAALATSREEGILIQQFTVPTQLQKDRQPSSQGEEQSLTDKEDSILRGEAPQVVAAAEAAREVAAAFRYAAAKPQTKLLEAAECLPPPGNPRSTDLGKHARAVTPTGPESGSTTHTSPGGSASTRLSWEDVLVNYSKVLLDLEGKHAKELQYYHHQVLLNKHNLRQAVAGLVSRQVLKQHPPAVGSVETHSEVKQDMRNAGASPEGQVFPTLQKESVGETIKGETNEGGSQSELLSSIPPTPTASPSSVGGQTAVPPGGFRRVGSGSAKDGVGEEDQSALAAALATVHWLWVAARAERGDGGQAESFIQRLQLAFPLARMSDIRAVMEAQQQLSLLHQRQITSNRVWARKRQRALADVLNRLETLTRGHRMLAENNKASLILRKRRSLLSEKLMQQRKQRDEQERKVAAAERAAREAQQKREAAQARREKLRREKEKACLAQFQHRRLLEAQEAQAKAAQAERAAEESSHVKLLRAARVARRQEQHSLRVLEQQLERQERQLQEELVRQRLVIAADKLKPLVERDPLRLYRQTAAFQSYAEAGVQQRQEHQEQLQHRLGSFGVEHSYSCATLMQDIRFRLSAALAESNLVTSKAAQELLLSINSRIEDWGSNFP